MNQNPQENPAQSKQPAKRGKPPRARKQVTGHIQAVNRRRIAGWAWDPNRPDSPIDVDILVGDKILATVKADQFQLGPQNEGKGNGKHRFVYDFPSPLTAGTQAALRVKISGTDIELEKSSKLLDAPKTAKVDSRGSVQGANAKRISGWAWDPSRPDVPVDVDIFDDDNLLATVKADQYFEGLLKAEIGNGKHRFSYEIPSQLKDGKEHTIRVKVSGTDIELKKSPKTVTLRGGERKEKPKY